MSLDFTHIWNSIELYSLYGELQLGGTLLSLHSLIKSVHDHFHSNLLVLSSPGVLVFRGKVSDHLCIIDDAEDDSCTYTSHLNLTVPKRIKAECQKLKKDGRVPIQLAYQ